MNPRDRRSRLQNIHSVAETLRSDPIEAPDFTRSILDRVDAERPFLAPSVRRKLPWVRIGIGACAVVATLAVALTHRWGPRSVQLAGQPAPISDVVQCVECAATTKLIALRPPKLAIADSDASRFLSAIATAAQLSSGEGQAVAARAGGAGESLPKIVDDSEPIVLSSLPTPSQDVPIASAPSARPTPDRPMTGARTSDPAMFMSSIYPAQSSLSGARTQPMLFSSELPRVRVVPSFLEHDLDGVILPR